MTPGILPLQIMFVVVMLNKLVVDDKERNVIARRNRELALC